MNLFSDALKEEEKALEGWSYTHIDECPINYDGAVGGRFTYMLIPTTLGVVTKITCACGAEHDATNYDHW